MNHEPRRATASLGAAGIVMADAEPRRAVSDAARQAVAARLARRGAALRCDRHRRVRAVASYGARRVLFALTRAAGGWVEQPGAAGRPGRGSVGEGY